jgi:cytoskeletal protein CcmA (bactofilin family)
MFAKREAKTGDAGAKGAALLPAPSDQRKPPKAPSLIAADMVIQGDIASEDELHVEGTVKGDIGVGRLTLGETGHIEGSIFAETVEVRGRVIGTIKAKVVRLAATACVEGDITHEQLSVENGAYFEGRSQKMQPTSADAAVVPIQAAVG